MCSDSELCGGLSILVLDEFLQLPPVNRKSIYTNVEDSHNLERFLALKMWHMLQCVEWTEAMR